MAKLTTEEFIAAIKELSVLELNELVKACEEEFGVSAAAGVVVAAAGPAAAAEEEKTEWNVELTEVGANKVKVIKVVRERWKSRVQRLPLSNLKPGLRTPEMACYKLFPGFLFFAAKWLLPVFASDMED